MKKKEAKTTQDSPKEDSGGKGGWVGYIHCNVDSVRLMERKISRALNIL